MSCFLNSLYQKYGEDFFKEEEKCGFLVTKERKELWAVSLDLLEKFIQVCKENNLRYFLCGGSLLGAIRHKGIIPWDDDIDVCMPREDYEILIRLDNCFTDPYFLQTPYNDDKYSISYIKVRNSETSFLSIPFIHKEKNMNMGIALDIFPIDLVNYNEIGEIRKRVLPFIYKTSSFMKKNALFLTEKEKQIVEQNWSPQDTNVSLYEKIQEMSKGTIYVDRDFYAFSSITVYDEKKLTYPKNCFSKTISVPFENMMVDIPSGYDEVLKIQFGNYMEFPKVENRGVWHNIEGLNTRVPYKEYIPQFIIQKKKCLEK